MDDVLLVLHRFSNLYGMSLDNTHPVNRSLYSSNSFSLDVESDAMSRRCPLFPG